MFLIFFREKNIFILEYKLNFIFLFIIPALRSINRNGPQTPLVFKELPPAYVLAQGPVFLNCLAGLDGGFLRIMIIKIDAHDLFVI